MMLPSFFTIICHDQRRLLFFEWAPPSPLDFIVFFEHTHTKLILPHPTLDFFHLNLKVEEEETLKTEEARADN